MPHNFCRSSKHGSMFRLALVCLLMMLATNYLSASPLQCPTNDSISRRIALITVMDYRTEEDRVKELLSYYRQVKACPRLSDSTHSYLLRRIGVEYGQLRNFHEAIEFTNRAIDVIRANIDKPSVNLSALANCYYNLQAYYDSTHQESLKWEAVDSCIATDVRFGTTYVFSSYMMKDKIRNLLYNGDYVRCIQYATLAEKILSTRDALQLDTRCYIILQHVNALIFSKRYDEAQKLLDTEWNSFFPAKQHAGSLYIVSGILDIYIGSYQKALRFFAKAADSSARSKYKPGSAEAFHWTGFLYAERMNQPSTGLTYYRKALSFADQTDSISVLSYIGKTYSRLKKYDSAFVYFQHAFDIIKPGSDERIILSEVLSQNPGDEIINNITELLINKGDAFLQQYKLNKKAGALAAALRTYTTADQLVSNLQSIHLEIESKLFWRDNTRKLYEGAIEACYLGNKNEDAYYFFEKGRSAILNAQLNEQRWVSAAGMTKLSQLRQEVYQIERSLNQMEKTSARFVEAEKSLFEKKQQLEALEKQVVANSPGYHRNMVDTFPVRIQDVQNKILNTHSALIELFAGDSAVYVFNIDPRKTTLIKIDKNAFDSLSRRFTEYLSNVELLNSHYDDFLKTSAQLYNLMFPNEKPSLGRVIVSPDGKYFPFEALVVKEKPVEYFVEKNAVSYTYSVRYLLNTTSNASSKSNYSFLGIAPVEFKNEWQLPNLTGSELSLSKIRGNFSQAASLVANNATRNNFLKDFYSYRIIQLYTHATDSGNGGEPTIYFSDSTLALSELIYSQRPITRLIVLSACETGSGKLKNGEGVFNFNRGFAAMGIPSSISNLWEIDAKATYELTELFYQHLAKGLPTDVAMQHAKKAFMNKDASHHLPYFWAAPILVGDSNDVIKVNSISWRWLYVLLPVMLIAVLLIVRHTQRR